MSKLLLMIINKIARFIRQDDKKEINYKSYQAEEGDHDEFS